jgi:long-chain acyl-CoA synthetase
VTRDDLTQIIFTSGATAEPKGVVIRHRNVLANVVPVEREVLKYRKYARPFSPLRFVNLLPLSHMFGQSMATNIRRWSRHRHLHAEPEPARRHPPDPGRRVSVLVCVPKILDVLREHVVRHFLKRPKRRRPARRFPRGGGATAASTAPRPEVLGVRGWRRAAAARPRGVLAAHGVRVIQGYGLTETAPIVTLNHPFKTSKGSVGTPIAGRGAAHRRRRRNPRAGRERDQRLLRRRRRRAGAGRVAAHRRHRRARRRGPRLHQGPQEGDDRHAGRTERLPEDVERAIDAQPGVRESAVVGIADAAQERVHAVLVLQNGVAPRTWCAGPTPSSRIISGSGPFPSGTTGACHAPTARRS